MLTTQQVTETNRLKQFKDQYNKVLIQSGADGAYLLAEASKIPPSGKQRSASINKKVKAAVGKKKKQMRENIRAA